jgi:hypothetical protein
MLGSRVSRTAARQESLMRSPRSSFSLRLLRVTACLAIATGVVCASDGTTPAAPANSRSYSAPRYDVHLAIEPDGSVSVREDAQFRFEGGPFRRVFREIPTRKTDGIVDVVATLDDEALTRGTGERQVEVDVRDDRTRIVWHLPPTADATVKLGLAYRARGVAERLDGSDRVAWTVLPDRHDYRVAASRTTITWPQAVTPIDTDEARKELWRATGEGRRASATTTRTAAEWTVDVADLRKNASYIVSLRFPSGSLTPQLSRWQERQVARAAAGGWLAAWAGLVALLGGAFVLLLWTRSPKGAFEQTPHGWTDVIAPDARPVAIASALRRRAPGGRREDLVPALIDLARRGALRFEAEETGRWSSRRFRLVKSNQVVRMAPHERVLLDAAFGADGTAPQVELSKVSRRTAREWKAFREAVTREMVGEGLIDPDRLGARRSLQVFGVATLAAGLVALPASGIAFGDRFGGLVVLPALAVLVVAMLAFIAASRISPLSDRGEREGARWRALAAALRDVARGQGALADAERIERWLPFASAAGVGAGLAARAHREGRPLPAWFRAGAGDQGRAGALAAMLSSGAAATGSHGGAGGAGAAGGGASGAS